MNYLAHLFLARPTADSHFGNLLGDFRRGVDISRFGNAVQLGLKNHYEVDRFTDSHTSVLAAKALFHESRRRFAPVALDIYFDHLLIKHWTLFTTQSFDDFREQSFSLLERRLPTMPRTMQHSVLRIMLKKRGLPRQFLLLLSVFVSPTLFILLWMISMRTKMK